MSSSSLVLRGRTTTIAPAQRLSSPAASLAPSRRAMSAAALEALKLAITSPLRAQVTVTVRAVRRTSA